MSLLTFMHDYARYTGQRFSCLDNLPDLGALTLEDDAPLPLPEPTAPQTVRRGIEEGDCTRVNYLLTQARGSIKMLTSEQRNRLKELGQIAERGREIHSIQLPTLSLSPEQIQELVNYFPHTRSFTCKSVHEKSLKLFTCFKELTSLRLLGCDTVISTKGVESLVGSPLERLAISKCNIFVDVLKKFPQLQSVHLNFKADGIPKAVIKRMFKEHETLRYFNGIDKDRDFENESDIEADDKKASVPDSSTPVKGKEKSPPTKKPRQTAFDEIRKRESDFQKKLNVIKRGAKTPEERQAVVRNQRLLDFSKSLDKVASAIPNSLTEEPFTSLLASLGSASQVLGRDLDKKKASVTTIKELVGFQITSASTSALADLKPLVDAASAFAKDFQDIHET
jgi:hypothetical protein